MKVQKRTILVVLLMISVCLYIFAAGAQETQETTKVKEISHWTWSNGSCYGAAWDLFMEKHPEFADVKYNFTSQGGSSQSMMQQIMLSYAAGAEVPDIVEMNFKLNPMLVESGIAADITDLMKPYEGKVPKFVWESASHNGRMYGIPLRGNGSMMLYREDLTKAAGIDMTQIKTWDQYIDAGKKLRSFYAAKGQDVYMISISPDKPADYWGEIMLSQQGIGFFDENGECIVDTDPRIIKAIKTMYRFYETGIATKLTELTPSWYGALAEGNVATILLAGWMPTILMNNVPSGAGLWRIAPYPEFENGKQGMQGTMGYTILTQDKAKQELAARVLLETAYDDDEVYALESKSLANLSALVFEKNPPKSEAIDKLNNYFGGQNVKAIDLEILKDALLFDYTPDFVEVLGIISSELSKAISNQKTIDQAIADMGTIIRRQVGTSKY